MVKHHPTQCCGDRPCGIADIMALVCHVILQDHGIKMSSNSVSKNPSS